jgi:hypothetical protein
MKDDVAYPTTLDLAIDDVSMGAVLIRLKDRKHAVYVDYAVRDDKEFVIGCVLRPFDESDRERPEDDYEIIKIPTEENRDWLVMTSGYDHALENGEV